MKDIKSADSIIKTDWTLPLTVDQVIWSQGADPAVMRRRRPKILRIAEDAVAEEEAVIHPALLYRRMKVENFYHDSLELEDGNEIKGEVIGKYLAGAEEIIVAVYTIGDALDDRMAEVMTECLPCALALDAMGTAAVDELGRQVQGIFRSIARANSMHLSMCFSPGMIGWPLDQGQPQIFRLLDGSEIGVKVADSGRMAPRKTVSAVYGMGSGLSEDTVSPCEFCAVRETCTYRGRHEEFGKV